MKRSSFGPRKSSLKRSPFSRKDSPFGEPSKATQMKRSEMKKRAKPKAPKVERDHMAAVAGKFCVVCRNEGLGESPAELHHPRFLAGGAQRSSNFDVIPLCPIHHRLGGFGIAIHAGRKTWENRFGTEAELLEQTKRETQPILEGME